MYNKNTSFNISEGLAVLDLSPDDLPIAKYKSRIIETVQNNQITVIYGETGSGKTTQIPKYLLESGINKGLVIGITQPRKIAAVSMARRVAQEMGCALGIEVGYQVRFENRYGGSTKIKYMTDGTLLNHCLSDPRLSDYGVIMIDEAHERAIHSDVLLGLLKTIIKKRQDLKILITSATMKTEKFSKYFNRAPIVSFEGRLFPVEIIYQNSYIYIEDTINQVQKIHRVEGKGDILVFLTGQEDIESCCESLKDIENLVVLPLYGSMDCDNQQKVFLKVPEGKRKVVVATNIAETTITIDGIKFVIDCGYVKQNTFNSNLGIDILEETRISKAQADQRKGRAGRTSCGKVYRLYSEIAYQMMNEETVPEIMRKNLCEIYLKIVTMGLDPITFDFIDPPDKETLRRSEKELQDLDLLDKEKFLTDMGRNMADLPVEPILGKVILSAASYGCTKEIVTIMSMMTEKNIFKRSNNYRQAEKHKAFFDPYGDQLTRLNAFNEFVRNEKSKIWCYDNFLNFETLSNVDKAREQLMMIINRKNIRLDFRPTSMTRDSIREAIIKGYYKNICTLIRKGTYIRHYDMQTLFVHPSSCLFKENPEIILYHEIVKTKKPYMHGILRLDPAILANFGPELKKINYDPSNAIIDRFVLRNCYDAQAYETLLQRVVFNFAEISIKHIILFLLFLFVLYNVL